MFKEITAISKNYAIVKIDNVINDDLLNLNVIFEENNKKILGEIEEIINSEAKITFLGEFINGKFFDGHFSLDDAFECVDSRVDRSVARCCRLKLFAADVQPDACHRTNAHAARHLKIFQAYSMACRAVGSGEQQDVVVVDVFLLVGKFEEVGIDFVELLRRKLHAQHVQAILQSGTTATRCEHD